MNTYSTRTGANPLPCKFPSQISYGADCVVGVPFKMKFAVSS